MSRIMQQAGKIFGSGHSLPTGQVSLMSNFFCQENLTKPAFWVENRVNFLFQNMKLGENGGRMAAFGAALAAGLSGSPEQAEAQDFNAYCAPLANGEVLESELTPQNMGYIFDGEGRVIAARADELTQHFGDGISETCDTGDVGAYVAQYGNRVMLEIYPPGQYPLSIAQETFQEINARYQACINMGLEVVDINENGRIDPNEDAAFYRDGEAFCNDELQRDLVHEGRLAALNAQQAAAEARTDAAETRTEVAEARIAAAEARMQAITDSLIADAREEVGL